MAAPDKGPWDFPVRGLAVGLITFAGQIDVVGYGDDGRSVMLRFEGAFDFFDLSEIRHLDVFRHSWEELSDLLSLRYDRITSATVTQTGYLHVAFASGRTLSAGADPSLNQEWEVTGRRFGVWGSEFDLVGGNCTVTTYEPYPRTAIPSQDSGVRLTENGPWDLPVRGFKVLIINLGAEVRVSVYDNDYEAWFDFEQAFEFFNLNEVHELNAATQAWAELSVVLSCATIESGRRPRQRPGNCGCSS